MGFAEAYNNLRSVYYNKGNYPLAVEYALKALKISETINDKLGIATVLGNIGIIYWNQGDYPKALDYNFRALKLAEELQDKIKTAAFLGNIGIIYYDLQNYPKALDHYFKALKIKEEIGSKNGIANTLGNIGIVYDDQSKIEKSDLKRKELTQKASDFYLKALKISIEVDDKNSIASLLANIGSNDLEQKKYKDSYDHLYRAIALADSIGVMDNVKRIYYMLSSLYEKSNISLADSFGGKLLNMEQMRLRALYYQKRYISVRDTLFSEENKKELVRKEMNFEFEKKEAAAKAEQNEKDAVAAAGAQKQRIVLILVSFVLLLVVMVAFIIFRSLRITRRQKKLIERQKEIVEEHQKEILDSIYYARRIQTALLPTQKYIERNLNKAVAK